MKVRHLWLGSWLLVFILVLVGLGLSQPYPYDCVNDPLNLNSSHCWNFDENVDDEVGGLSSSSSGTIYSSDTLPNFGLAIESNSNGDYVDLGLTDINVGGNYTICGWHNYVNQEASQDAIMGSQTGGANDMIWINARPGSGETLQFRNEQASGGDNNLFVDGQIHFDGEWNHLCFVQNGTGLNTKALYINATFQARTGGGAESVLSGDLDNNLALFGRGTTELYSQGKWDNLLIWNNTALSPEQVSQIFDGTEPTRWSPPRSIDHSPAMLVTCPSTGNCIDQNDTDTNGATGWSQVISEVSSPFTRGQHNYGRQVTESSDNYLFNGTNNVMTGTGGTFCYSYWLNSTPSSGAGLTVTGTGGGGFDHDASLSWDTDSWRWSAEDESGTLDVNNDFNSIFASNPNTWHSMCINWSSTVRQVRLDNRLLGTITGFPSGQAGWYAVDSTGVRLGNNHIITAVESLNGIISDIVWWDKQDTAELNLIYNYSITGFSPPRPYPEADDPFNATRVFHLNSTSGTTAIDSISGADGTLVNTEDADWVPSLVSHTFGNAIDFDGVDEGMDSNWGNGGQFLCDAMSISFWVKTTDTGATRVFTSAGFDDNTYSQLTGNSLGDLRTQFGQTGEINALYTGQFTAMADGAWHHMALVKEAGCTTSSYDLVHFYVDAVELTPSSITDDTMANNTFTGDWGFGMRVFDEAAPLDAEFDDILIWGNYSLTASQVLTIYLGNYSTDEAPPPPVDTTPPVILKYNVTSNNVLEGENTQTWNVSGTINVTTNLLAWTHSTNESSNCSARLDVEQNYTAMVAVKPEYKLATTETTLHAGTLFDNITDGVHCMYVSCIDSSGNEPTADTSTSGCLNIDLDSTPPNISFVDPSDITETYSASPHVQVNITAFDGKFNNSIIFLYNTTGLVSSDTSTVVGAHFFNFTALTDGVYFFNATASDTFGNVNKTDTRNKTIDTTLPLINFTQPTLGEDSRITVRHIEINVTATDVNFQYINISLYNSSGAEVGSVQRITSPGFINFTDVYDGNFSFNATSVDLAGNKNSTETRNVSVDATHPPIQFVSPTTAQGTFSLDYISANVTATDNNLFEINISLYNSSGLVNSVKSSTSPLFVNFTGLSLGDYFLNASATDSFGNVNKTETRNITLELNVTIAFSSGLTMNFVSNGSLLLSPSGQTNTIGLFNVTNHGPINSIIKFRINYTNNPYQQFIIDSEFDSWTVETSLGTQNGVSLIQDTNETYNLTLLCSDIQPVTVNVSTPSSGDLTGRLRYRFDRNHSREYYNLSNNLQLLNSTFIFNGCPSPSVYFVNEFNFTSLDGSFTNISVDYLGDGSNSTLEFYVGNTLCGNATLFSTAWRTFSCGHTFDGTPFNLTFNVTNSTPLSGLNSIYVDNIYAYNRTLISDFLVFTLGNSSNLSQAVNLTETQQEIFTIEGNDQSFMWLWVYLKKQPPLGLLFDLIEEVSG